MTDITKPDIERAGRNLARCWATAARAIEADLGFSWRPSVSAPSDYSTLATEFRSCLVSGLPLRVSCLHCDDTIYPGPATNQEFRFVHDVTHVLRSADFDAAGELEVSRAHLRRLQLFDFDERSLEYLMLVADTAGQTMLFEETGRFPIHQKAFVLRCINHGIPAAIEAEATTQIRAA